MQKIEITPLTKIRPACYNPRRIMPKQFVSLKESLAQIGCVVPILVNRDNFTIVAGHQRTKAMQAIGMTHAPVIFISGINAGDEMSFNQLHNGTEIRAVGSGTYRGNAPIETFAEADYNDFTIEGVSGPAVKETCRLLVRYGNTLSCVACAGKVYLGSAYIRACQCLRMSVNIYVCDGAKKPLLEKYFNQDYGEFFYDNLERKTYLQGLAQMNRNVEMRDGIRKQNKSITYVTGVLPFLKAHPEIRSILDFGCGKGAYITDLAKHGYDAVGVEFFNQNGKSIDIGKGNRQIDDLIAHLKERGRFDLMVCDSVINSVDSMEAERSVLRCLNAFAKPNAPIFVSGRTLKSAQREQLFSFSGDMKSMIRFLDGENFTAKYRKGSWYFQHFHSRDTFEASLATASLKIEEYSETSCAFMARCSKTAELAEDDVKAAIDFEFNLPLPQGRRYGRNAEVFAAWKGTSK